LRAEAQGAFNHGMFGEPNLGPVNSLLGQVNLTVWGEQRPIAVGGKLYWKGQPGSPRSRLHYYWRAVGFTMVAKRANLPATGRTKCVHW
jgi:hypothetical protein